MPEELVFITDGFLQRPVTPEWWGETVASLNPAITTPEQYFDKKARNHERALRELKSSGEMLVTSPERLKHYHGVLFDGIAPWAGEFASTQREFGFRYLGPAGYLFKENVGDLGILGEMPFGLPSVDLRPSKGAYRGVLPKLAAPELALFDAQLGELQPHVKSVGARFRLAAYYFSRLVGIHVFTDGNGSLARCLTENAIKQLTGKTIKTVIDVDEYAIQNLVHEFGNIGPFSDTLAKVFGANPCPRYFPSPYQIAPQKAKLSPGEALRRSRLADPETISTRSSPLERNWFEDWNLGKVYPKPLYARTVNFTPAARTLREAQGEKLTVGAAIMLIQEIQRLQPAYITRDSRRFLLGGPDEREVPVNFAKAILKPVILGMSPEAAEEVMGKITGLFHGTNQMQAADFNTMFKNALNLGQRPLAKYSNPTETGPVRKQSQTRRPKQG